VTIRTPDWPDARLERGVAVLLRAGVILASALVLVGGALSLTRHGASAVEHHAFRGEPADLRGLAGILREAGSMEGRGVVQLGLLVLFATPVARVALMVYAFARQRDWLYAGVTLFVLGMLLYSLLASTG
jgi:uncharacterized membrane protein